MLNRLLKDKVFLIVVAAVLVATVIKLAQYNVILLYMALAVVMMGLSKYALDFINILEIKKLG